MTTTTTISPKVFDVLNALEEGYRLPSALDPEPTPNQWHGVDIHVSDNQSIRLVEDDTDFLVYVLVNGVPLTKASFTWTTSDAIAAFIAFFLN